MKIKKNVKPHSGKPVCKRMIDVMASLEKNATRNKSAGVAAAGLATSKTFKELELRTQQV